MVWDTRLVSKLAAAATSSSTLFKKLSTKNHPTLSKLGANLITTQNHPISTLSKQKHSFSNHFGGYKSPPLIISSKYGQYYPNNVFMVKHYNTYGSYQGQEWRRKILCYSKTHFVFFVGSFVILVGTMLYIACFETIPYTNRSHFVLLPPSDDKFLAEKMFEKVELVVLPEEHPDSVRVKSIGDKIVKALESDLKAMKGKELTVRHLVDIKWEFQVVKDTNIMMAVPWGKIYLSSDLLKHFESDAEIATIIGHEVGHIVARHVPGRINMAVLANLANTHLGLAISISKMTERIPHGLKELGRVLFTYPRMRRDEKEADYIGLLLMASAGFDPQEAPKVYATYDQLFPSSKSYFYEPYPSGKERAIALLEVLEEANYIYSKTIQSSWKEDS